MIYKAVRTTYRCTHFSIHIITALLICSFVLLVFKRHWFQGERGRNIIQWWHKQATCILGLTITQKGSPFNSTTLTVANHISFLDIMVIASSSPVTFLSKSTLRYWPIIGFVANSVGTLFIERHNKRSLYKTIPLLTQALNQNKSLVIFPEGTTTIGRDVGKFYSSLFQSAINANKPIQPIALRYLKNGNINTTAAYIENDNFILTLIKIMSQSKTEATITFCNTIFNNKQKRGELAMESHAAISQEIE